MKIWYIFLNGFGFGLFLRSLFDIIYNSSLQLSSIIMLFIGIFLWIISIWDYHQNKKD